MRTDQGRREIRYETIIATLVGVSALFVSGYTAYVQRQQVRAAVWPILQYSTGNEPVLHFTLANKGVGPAIIRNVVVRVDGEPVRKWHDALQKLLGPGDYKFTQSTISGHVLSAGESMEVLVPQDDENHSLTFEKGGPIFKAFDNERARVAVEICYCSTLGECWTLRSGPTAAQSPKPAPARTLPPRRSSSSDSGSRSSAMQGSPPDHDAESEPLLIVIKRRLDEARAPLD